MPVDFSFKTLSVSLICLVPVPLWLLAGALGSEVMALIAAGVGVFLGLRWFYALLHQPALMLGFLKVGGVSLLVMLSLSWIMAVYFNETSLRQSISTALAMDVGTTFFAYAGAVSYGLIFASVIGWLGDHSFIIALEGDVVKRLKIALRVDHNKLLVLIVLFSVLEVWLIIIGVISYRSYAVAGYDEGRIAWFIPILEIIFLAQIGLNALSISQMADGNGRGRKSLVIVVVSVALGFFLFQTHGRRELILFVALHFYWITFFMGRLPKLKYVLSVATILIPIGYVAVLLFTFMRHGAVDPEDMKRYGFNSYISESFQLLVSDPNEFALERERSASNLASRPLVAHPLAKSMDLPKEGKRFMLGENLVNSLIWAMPSILISNKKQFAVQEDLLYRNFPVGTDDTAISPYLEAYCDFGYVGLIVYPFLIAGMWVGMLALMRVPFISSFEVLVLACSLIPLYTLSFGESTMITWFAQVRNGILAILIFIVLDKLIAFPRHVAYRSHAKSSP